VESGLVDLAQVKRKSFAGAIEDKPEAVEQMLSRLVPG
jgi:hypothetical protein